MNKPKDSKNPQNKKRLTCDPPYPGGGPRPPFPPGAKLGGDLILSPEQWKKINEIAADPEKYMYDEDEHNGSSGYPPL
jgi:hypothetical protein